MKSTETDQPHAGYKSCTVWDDYQKTKSEAKRTAILAFQATLSKPLLISDIPWFIGFWRTPSGVVSYQRFRIPCFWQYTCEPLLWDPDSRVEYTEQFIKTLNFLMTQPAKEDL